MNLSDKIKDKYIFLIGIKGTGMSALALWLKEKGALVSGSDVEEEFYTDELLKKAGISWRPGFDVKDLPEETDIIAYSAAYNTGNPQLERARSEGRECYSYPQMLGRISEAQPSAGIAGIHGKTSTTALCGTLTKALGYPSSVIVGSSVPAFGGSAVLHQGDEALFAETCEYKRHFLYFSPTFLLVTSIEEDHLDYFTGYDDIMEAFVSYCARLPEGGVLVYCADDKGSSELASRVAFERPDVKRIPYGFEAESPWRITDYRVEAGLQLFKLGGFQAECALRVPGRHMVQNAAGALALHETVRSLQYPGTPLPEDAYIRGLRGFSGTKRRSEIVGEEKNILVLDDYGHHPTAVRKTLEGFRDFYPGRRIIVSFMSHTYSRTEALLDEFATAFGAADHVILHKIYASAREKVPAGVNGRVLFEETRKHHTSVSYFHEVDEALPYIMEYVRPGDIFITMGAGNNWPLGVQLLASLKES